MILFKRIEAIRETTNPIPISVIIHIIKGIINKMNDLIFEKDVLIFFHITLFHALTIITTAHE